MGDKRRTPPGVWAKNLARLLSGDDKCWLGVWYQTHHFTDKLPEDDASRARLEEWQVEHDGIVARRSASLKHAGFVVKQEPDTAFKLVGKTGNLTGKPDLVGLKPDRAVVIDAKAGKERQADVWQVLIYMLALPRTWLPANLPLVGQVEYKNKTVEVAPITTEQAKIIGVGVRTLTDFGNSPSASPNKWQCLRCPMLTCTARYTEAAAGNAEDLF